MNLSLVTIFLENINGILNFKNEDSLRVSEVRNKLAALSRDLVAMVTSI